MALRDWQEFGITPLVLPVRGVMYEVPPVSTRAGLAIQAMPDDTPGTEWFRMVVGDALWQRLLDDDVADSAVSLIGRTAWADYTQGRAAAEALWEANGDPELAGRSTAAPASKVSASTTRKRASGTATKTAASQTPRARRSRS